MICRDFSLLYSAHLDGHVAEDDQIALQRHLRECAMCRRRAAEMRSLRADLRALAAPFTSPELTGQIQRRLRQEAASRARVPSSKAPGPGLGWGDVRRFWFNSFANWLEGYRAIIFSQSVGAIVSLLMFFVVVTEIFEQAHRKLAPISSANQTIFEDPNIEALRYEAQLKAALLYPPPPPALNPNPEFQGVAASLSDEDVVLTVEVRKDGAGKVMDVMPPNDPSIQAKLSTALSQRGTFQSVKPNQNISPVAVVYLSSITTTGRL